MVVIIINRSIKPFMGILSMQLLSRQCAVVLECSFCFILNAVQYQYNCDHTETSVTETITHIGDDL